jgi:hypothetical protein
MKVIMMKNHEYESIVCNSDEEDVEDVTIGKIDKAKNEHKDRKRMLKFNYQKRMR